jgi:hypothetical protein
MGKCGPATGGGGVRYVDYGTVRQGTHNDAQLLLRDPRGTIVPVIIASDKTTMTKLSGNQSAYPVYLTIGNISKSVRRKASRHATVILGYLPVDKFGDVPNKRIRKQLKGELLHRAMRSIMEPLEEAGRTGVEMWCADGHLRRVYPLLASFVGDWPEQNDMACTSESGCPICLKRWHGRGDEREARMRETEETLVAIDHYQRTGRTKQLRQLGLRRWWPWWANLPNVTFGACVTPDLLHQLYKGVFKSHAMRWVQKKMTAKRVDDRFAAMSRAKDLRHFKRGISIVEQWTGRETKEMMKVFLAIIAEDPHLDDDLVSLVRTLLDFGYMARAPRMTEKELDELREGLATMQRLKQVLVRQGIYGKLSRLDKIAKWHMITHYPDSVTELGTPDGYSTESPEFLHIVYVKRGFEASNKRDAIPQIIQFCQRMEALRIHRAYLDEYYGVREREVPAPTTVYLVDSDKDVTIGGNEGNEDDEWVDEEEEEAVREVEEAERGVRVTRDFTYFASDVEYPRPELALALRPTRLASWQELTDQYGTKDLLRTLTVFLGPKARGQQLFVLPCDRLDVWHKVSLYHLPLSFAPDEPPHRDVIRTQPPELDSHGRVSRAGVFDTVLFLDNSDEFGIYRESLFHILDIPHHANQYRTIKDTALVAFA